MNKIKVDLVAAARPNFMKIAPLFHELNKHDKFEVRFIHAGQHYDYNMSQAFLNDLKLPEPYVHLGVGSGTHGEQTGKCLIEYEKVLLADPPDWVVVAGDVNATLACALAARKLNIKVAHLEAGLRSFDWTMPEEINRILTDQISDVLWTHSPEADENLIREGIDPARISRVGNTMIDSLVMLRDKIENTQYWKTLNLKPKNYGLLTLHRPSNVDHASNLEFIVDTLIKTSHMIPLVFPVHPRTKQRLKRFGMWDKLESCQNINLLDPLPYIDFMSLVFNCCFAITDSGGLQEETTYLGIPCLTMRENTERPVTVSQGTNYLTTFEQLGIRIKEILDGKWHKGVRPEFWDGKTAKRIAHDLTHRIF